MKINFIKPLWLVAGVMIGGIAMWTYSCFERADRLSSVERLLGEVLLDSQRTIEPNRWHCESDKPHTVAAVLASILSADMAYSKNSLEFQCQYMDSGGIAHCFIGYSSCRLWSASDCGSRLLEFAVDADQKVRSSSYSCVDVP